METIKNLQDGIYGDKWKVLFESVPHAAINADKSLYVCSACGSFKNEPILSIYEPLNERLPRNDSCTIANSDLDYEYVMSNELPEKYRLVKSYVHKCFKCGRRMRRYADGDQLKCPKCKNSIMELADTFMWD